MSLFSFILCAVLIFLNAFISFIPFIRGSLQRAKTLKPLEYFPPRGASPIDVACNYYGRRARPREIFNPLMLYWAQRGFITIEEDCKRGLKLTKVKDICEPTEADGFNILTFQIEVKLFKHLFEKKDTFYTLTASSEFEKFYDGIMEEISREAEKVGKNDSKLSMYVCSALTIILTVIVTVAIGLNMDSMLIVAAVFPIVGIIFMRFVAPQFRDTKSAIGFIIYPFFALWSGMPYAVVIWASPIDCSIVLTVAFLVAVINLFVLTKNIDIRNDEQLKMYGRICGFKNFLIDAELEKLEMLVEENPEYYFEILPYCYILRITEKLKYKFDAIIMDGAGWYLGDLRNTLMF